MANQIETRNLSVPYVGALEQCPLLTGTEHPWEKSEINRHWRNAISELLDTASRCIDAAWTLTRLAPDSARYMIPDPLGIANGVMSAVQGAAALASLKAMIDARTLREVIDETKAKAQADLPSKDS